MDKINTIEQFVSEKKELYELEMTKLKESQQRISLTSTNRANTSDIAPFQSSEDKENLDKTTKHEDNIAESGQRRSSSVSAMQNTSPLNEWTKNCKKTKIPIQHDMEEWVTDSFYKHFPSFNNESEKYREQLSQNRHQEYQTFLINQKLSKNKTNKKTRTQNSPSGEQEVDIGTKKESLNSSADETKNAKQNDDKTYLTFSPSEAPAQALVRLHSPRYKLLEDLKHSNIILSEENITYRNKKVVEDKNKKKMDYQRELIQQISDKKKEVEYLKMKEQEEEERLTKRLEEQLKIMELEERLEKEKKEVEKTRLTNEKNHLNRMHLVSKLENDHKLYNPYTERKTHSENGKDKFIPKTDKDIYKYFSNSARYEKRDGISHQSSTTGDGNQDHQYCKRCRVDLVSGSNHPIIHWQMSVCSECGKRLRHTGENVCSNCNVQYTTCTECAGKLNVCEFCKNLKEYCPKCLRKSRNWCYFCNKKNSLERSYITEIESDVSEIIEAPSARPANTYKVLDIDYGGNELSPSSDHHKKPFSLNLAKNSLFHPDKEIVSPKLAVNIKNGEAFLAEKKLAAVDINKIKRKTDERLFQYVKNYDDLRKRRPSQSLARENPVPEIQSFRPNYFENEKKSKSIKMLEQKVEVPHVQRNIAPGPGNRVLTQLGAIRKQLQLDKMRLDDTE